jgi:hypothetical protein
LITYSITAIKRRGVKRSPRFLTSLKAFWFTKAKIIASFCHASTWDITVFKASVLTRRRLGVSSIAVLVAELGTLGFLSWIVQVAV